MKDEHKTKEQLIQELLEMRQRIAELEASETRRKRVEQGIPGRRIWLPVAGMFVLLSILVWLNEILDLPHLLLGAPHTPINWRESITEMVLIASVGLFAVLRLIRDITERKRAEEALQQYAERLRALTAQMAEVAEAERQRLARELHDQVGQNLTALGINLNIVRTQMPEETAAPVRSRLDDSLSLVEQTAARIRDVMANLRPPVLDDYGLVAALHWYREQFTRRTDIAIAVEGEEPVPRLAARVENALFRIAQEALTNVAKHAQATQVTVTVEVDSGTLRLAVADDGIGFDPAHPAEPDGGRGWGLLTMTERAEAVGGRCRIESYPGQGTRVIVEVAR